MLLSGSLEDRLRYFETLHHDTLRHRITKRDTENQPHGRIVEYASHKRSVQLQSVPCLLLQTTGVRNPFSHSVPAVPYCYCLKCSAPVLVLKWWVRPV